MSEGREEKPHLNSNFSATMWEEEFIVAVSEMRPAREGAYRFGISAAAREEEKLPRYPDHREEAIRD